MTEVMVRPLYEIAADIREDWTRPYFGAVPYIEALDCLDTVDGRYIYEDGRTIVLYFLANAGSWRGPVARRIKAELKWMVK